MKKLSWPPYSDLNLMEDDIAMDSNSYDTFVGEGKSTTSDSEELEELTMEDPSGYSEGMMFPVDDLFQVQIDSEEYFALESMSKRFSESVRIQWILIGFGPKSMDS